MTILLEEGYQTNLSAVMASFRQQVETLNWLVTDLRCLSLGDWPPLIEVWESQSYDLEPYYSVVPGKTLYETFAGRNLQVVWGVFCGLAGDIPALASDEIPYADGNPRIWSEPESFQVAGSAIEIIAFDSSFTLLKFRDESFGLELLESFPNGRIIQSPDDMLKSYQ